MDTSESTAFESVEITRVELGRDLEPAFLNERIPITIGITAHSGVPGEEPTESVPLVVTFVDPQDPDEVGCSSNGMLFDLVGDGVEHEYEGFIWPPNNCAHLTGKTVTLQIELDPTAEQPLIEPLVLSQARAEEPANAACRNPEPGCVQEFRLEIPESNQVDIEFAGFDSESSVGVIPPLALPTEGTPERATPILVAQNLLVFNGRDPYESPIDADTIPAELLAANPDIAEELRFGRSPDQVETLDDLPGPLHLRYEITAAADGETWLPLGIGEGDATVDEAVLTELLPGTPNVIAHDLYLEGAAYDAVLDPEQWLGEEAFVVRSCFTTDFPQFRALADEAKCRTIDVLLVPQGDVESGATSFGFDRESNSSHGNSRIKLESRFATSNHVGLDGVFSNTEANLTVKGDIGKSFTLDLVRANATLDAPLLGDRSVDVGLRIFNDDVFSFAEQASGLTVSEDVVFSRSKTIVRARFMFGPVPVSFNLDAGGAVGILAEGSATFLQGEEACRPHLPLASAEDFESRAAQEQVIANIESTIEQLPAGPVKTLLRQILLAPLRNVVTGNPFDPGESSLSECVALEASVGPTMNLTASAFGGIDIGIAKAGVQLDLVLAQVDLPLTGKLSLGRNEQSQFLAFASTQLDLIFQPLDGDLKLVGKLKLGPFKKSKSVSIVKFRVDPIEKSLLSRSTLAAEVLTP
ncbi:hypothetical protein [Enhygromyxa salina]|uniref:hypothetical protein n=1 Tax=Enhygromyxa salina TaxID=215803 RepID=UPI0011B28FBC|nr:hypothetical protein [Enhygromyxa salina]